MLKNEVPWSILSSFFSKFELTQLIVEWNITVPESSPPPPLHYDKKKTTLRDWLPKRADAAGIQGGGMRLKNQWRKSSRRGHFGLFWKINSPDYCFSVTCFISHQDEAAHLRYIGQVFPNMNFCLVLVSRNCFSNVFMNLYWWYPSAGKNSHNPVCQMEH